MPQHRPSALPLDGEALDLVAQGLDLASQLTGLVRVDAGRDDGTADAAGAAQHRLARDVDVGSALVLAQEGDVQQDGERLGVGGEDGDFAGAAVQRFGHCGPSVSISRTRGEGQNEATYPRWRPSWPDAGASPTAGDRGSPG